MWQRRLELVFSKILYKKLLLGEKKVKGKKKVKN